MNTLQCHNTHVLAFDLDDTLVATERHPDDLRHASDEALHQIGSLVTSLRAQSSHAVYFGSATGRTFPSVQRLADEHPAFNAIFPAMDFHIVSVGSAIHTGARQNYKHLSDWPSATGWNRKALLNELATHPDLTPQTPEAQSAHKLSYLTRSPLDAVIHALQLRTHLKIAGLQADVIVSGEGPKRFVDVIPVGAHKGGALLEIPRLLEEPKPSTENYSPSKVCRIVAGDSLNDQAALAVADMSIIPSNGQPGLVQWVRGKKMPDSFYIADEPFAAGVLQGLRRHLYSD